MSERVTDPSPAGQSVPDTFVAAVKEALEHLYDFAHLQQMALAGQLRATKRRDSVTDGHHLRRELILAVETLSPGPGALMNSPDARLYSLLQLHYIDGLTVQDVGNRLGLSTRQAHRSLRRAEAGVAAILWARLEVESADGADHGAPDHGAAGHGADASSAAQLSSLPAEIAQLAAQLTPTDVRDLIAHAGTAVAPLLEARGLQLSTDYPDRPVIVAADDASAGQVLVSLLSRLAQRMAPGELSVRCGLAQGQVVVTLSAPAAPAAPDEEVVDDLVQQLLARLGWQVSVNAAGAARQQVTLTIPPHGALVLVVDDNEGLLELLDRFLTSHDYRVVAATSGEDGLALLDQARPDAVILDAMMPGMSGWQVLQTIRNRPETASVPVIICSVFDDPGLAYSLGASYFLSKPIRRDEILDALQALGIR